MKNAWLSFQYISHRVLRWAIVPFALVLILIANASLVQQDVVYQIAFLAQIAFYSMALLGLYYEKLGKKVKILYVPYYFSLMNYAAFAGLKRFVSNQQNVIWEKATRAA